MSTYNIPFSTEKNKKITLNLQLLDFFKGFKNEFVTAKVNEPSVFEPLKFYCIHHNKPHFAYFDPFICKK